MRPVPDTAPLSDRRAWAFFVAWTVVGAAYALGLLGALSIGILVLPVAGLATAVLATRRGAERGATGLVSGLSLPLFYVTYLNRGGPGVVCNGARTECHDAWNPWMWAGAGMSLLIVGVTMFLLSERQRRAGAADFTRSPPPTSIP